jgi:hypothetical protein
LNYILLDPPNLTQLAKNRNNSTHKLNNQPVQKFTSLSSASSNIITAYLEGPAATTYIDALMEEQVKGLGRKKYKTQTK